MTTPTTPTTAQIKALRSEARYAGDEAQAALCQKALAGDPAALAACARALALAAVMVDDSDDAVRFGETVRGYLY